MCPGDFSPEGRAEIELKHVGARALIPSRVFPLFWIPSGLIFSTALPANILASILSERIQLVKTTRKKEASCWEEWDWDERRARLRTGKDDASLTAVPATSHLAWHRYTHSDITSHEMYILYYWYLGTVFPERCHIRKKREEGNETSWNLWQYNLKYEKNMDLLQLLA